jgi:hypothetical protein
MDPHLCSRSRYVSFFSSPETHLLQIIQYLYDDDDDDNDDDNDDDVGDDNNDNDTNDDDDDDYVYVTNTYLQLSLKCNTTPLVLDAVFFLCLPVLNAFVDGLLLFILLSFRYPSLI